MLLPSGFCSIQSLRLKVKLLSASFDSLVYLSKFVIETVRHTGVEHIRLRRYKRLAQNLLLGLLCLVCSLCKFFLLFSRPLCGFRVLFESLSSGINATSLPYSRACRVIRSLGNLLGCFFYLITDLLCAISNRLVRLLELSIVANELFYRRVQAPETLIQLLKELGQCGECLMDGCVLTCRNIKFKISTVCHLITSYCSS